MVLLKQFFIDKQPVSDNLLRDCHKLSVYRIGYFYDVPKVFHIFQYGQIFQITFAAQRLYGIRIQQVNIIQSVARPVKRYIIICFFLVIFRCIGAVFYPQTKLLLRDGDCHVECVSCRFRFFHRAEQVYDFSIIRFRGKDLRLLGAGCHCEYCHACHTYCC